MQFQLRKSCDSHTHAYPYQARLHTHCARLYSTKTLGLGMGMGMCSCIGMCMDMGITAKWCNVAQCGLHQYSRDLLLHVVGKGES